MENKKIKLKMTTVSTANPVSVIKGTGEYKEKNGRILITHVDKENVKTAIIINKDEKVILTRTCELYSYRIPIKQDETLKGIIGEENTFLVIGKRVEIIKEYDETHLFLEYELPDLSDEPVGYKVEIEY